MIRKIAFQNYKAFEKGEIKLRPITILLGANSVGKSSIINLLLMLQQTASSKNYKSALRLHGENVSMGECENIFRNKNTEKNIVIDFEFKSDELFILLKKELFDDFIQQISRPIQFLWSSFPKSIVKNEFKIEFNQFVSKNGEINEKVYSSKEIFLKLVSTIEDLYSATNSGSYSDMLRYYFRGYDKRGLIDKKNMEQLYDYLFEIRKIKENTFNLSFTLGNVKFNKEDVIKIYEVSLLNNDKCILHIKFNLNQNNTAYKNAVITSDFTKGDEIFDKLTKDELLKLINLNFSSTIFSWMPLYNKNRDFFFRQMDEEGYSIAILTINQIIGRAIDSVKCQFSRELVNHVSPLRASPKRYYFLDRANINTFLDTFDGNSLTEILKENETVKKKVNKWLETFGLEVNVSTLQDVIHKLKVNQHSLDLDIIDVGFGISQILPVIVQGFLSFDNSLTMMEQPEIHLHPKMQAELADLFIDIVNGATIQKGKSSTPPKKYLLIETHSEYLLRRLMRRISDGKISAKDVAIYFIEPPKNVDESADIKEKEISDDGAFEWPRDFYEGEMRKDKANYIKQLFFRKK
jgi:predicted ATPase